jgi:hypothetical protein
MENFHSFLDSSSLMRMKSPLFGNKVLKSDLLQVLLRNPIFFSSLLRLETCCCSRMKVNPDVLFRMNDDSNFEMDDDDCCMPKVIMKVLIMEFSYGEDDSCCLWRLK